MRRGASFRKVSRGRDRGPDGGAGVPGIDGLDTELFHEPEMRQAGHALEVPAELAAAALDLDGERAARRRTRRSVSCPNDALGHAQARICGQALQLAEAVGGGGAGRES
ncbi:MAG: hypothetical protein MZV70_69310 [Desulfobacterales bacterium]|nr:hypothetical protein [Desulfobacterales bacterium]